MYHSITFGDKNTWDDWHLIPSSRPLFAPPTVNTSYIDIPGMDGQLDASDALVGYATFKNRSGSWDFVVAEGYGTWNQRYMEITEYLHGQKMKAILEDEPEYYYEGRFSVNSWKSGDNWSGITIDYNVGPYKKELHSTMDEWEWDTFNFETSVIQSFAGVPVLGTTTITIHGSKQPVTPSFITTAEMSVTFNSATYALPQGTSKVAKIIIKEGTNVLTFTGNGEVSVDYRGGRL